MTTATTDIAPAPSGGRLPFAATQAGRWIIGSLVTAIVVGDTIAMLWLWNHGGNLHPHDAAATLTSLARVTGYLGAYLALLQCLLLARLTFIEQIWGFDRLTIWHRWNGHVCLYLILAHVVFSIWGYSIPDKLSLWGETSTMIWGGIYPGMITATVGTFLLVIVVFTSLVIVRRAMKYEWWYLVHFASYAGIALGWFHQIPTGGELVVDTNAQFYWKAQYVVTIVLIVWFRLLVPIWSTLYHRMKVAEVIRENEHVVTVRITGHRLDKLKARPGQFFVWRFLAKGHWWTAHPFSISELPDGTLRITVKDLGDHSGHMDHLQPGTRIIAEGPFGVFTSAVRTRNKVLLIAGGIGITPVRALAEELFGDVVVIYRAMDEGEVIFRDELERITAKTGAKLLYVIGDHRTPEGARLLSAEHLLELVPDIAERDTYLCGPPGMTHATERNVRKAGAHRRHVHVERFAYSES